MSFLDSLRALFGAGKSRDDDGLYFYIRCGRCGEVVRVRASRQFDLEQEFDQTTDTVQGYVLHKEILGSRCPQLMQLEVNYDRGRREVGRTVEGGEFATPPDR